jgi:hypothetical protein
MIEQLERQKQSRSITNSVTRQKRDGKECLGTVDNRPTRVTRSTTLARADDAVFQRVQTNENNTGLHDAMIVGRDSLSERNRREVNVGHNSAPQGIVGRHTQTLGRQIHLGAKREEGLRQNAWHMARQRQGRLRQTPPAGGGEENDHRHLGKGEGYRERDELQKKNLNLPSKKNTPRHAGTAHLIYDKVISSNRVIQRVGDKMAMEYEDPTMLSPSLKKLQTAIQNIYLAHKITKKYMRNKLDEDYVHSIERIRERTDYLFAAVKIEGGKIAGVQVSKSAGRAMGKSKLPEQIKGVLNAEATRVAQTMMSAFPLALRLDATAIHNASMFYSRHAIADPIVQGYEEGYKASAMNKERIIAMWKAVAEQSGYYLSVNTHDDVGQVLVSVVPGTVVARLATIYFNDQRFVRKPLRDVTLGANTGRTETREVYEHRNSGKEYVQDANGVFIKRYLKRALNKYDNPGKAEVGARIEADPRTARDGRTWRDKGILLERRGAQEEKYSEIRKHQRAKEAEGGSPFVSFTTTDHPIFGSSAKNFEGEHGVATVDMAKIRRGRVFDTHTTGAMHRIHQVADPNPSLPFKEEDEQVERNSAARDAMRTREVVVTGGIPDYAIMGVKVKREGIAPLMLEPPM